MPEGQTLQVVQEYNDTGPWNGGLIRPRSKLSQQLVFEAGGLHKQLLPFQRNDLEIVDRRMMGFGYFRFQRAMPFF